MQNDEHATQIEKVKYEFYCYVVLILILVWRIQFSYEKQHNQETQE